MSCALCTVYGGVASACVMSREAEPGGGGARAGVGPGARAAAAVLRAPRHAAHRQRSQLGLRALRVPHASFLYYVLAQRLATTSSGGKRLCGLRWNTTAHKLFTRGLKTPRCIILFGLRETDSSKPLLTGSIHRSCVCPIAQNNLPMCR